MNKLSILMLCVLPVYAGADSIDPSIQLITCAKYNSLVDHLSTTGLVTESKAAELKACQVKVKSTEEILKDYYVNFVTTEHSQVLPFFTNFNDASDNLYIGSDIPMSELAGYRFIIHRDIKANVGYQYSESSVDISSNTRLSDLTIYAKTDKVVNRAVKLIAPDGSLIGGRTTYAHYDIPATNDWFITKGVITATVNKPADYAY